MESNIESNANSCQHLTESYFINYNDHRNAKMEKMMQKKENEKKRKIQSKTLSWFNEKTTHTMIVSMEII